MAQEWYYYEGFNILGVFTTKEKAEEICQREKNKKDSVGDFYDVEEVELDKLKKDKNGNGKPVKGED